MVTYTPNTRKYLLAWCQNTLCPVSSRNLIKIFHKSTRDRLGSERKRAKTQPGWPWL